jgi:hypothetical protein
MDVPDRIDPTTIKHLGISLPALGEVDSVADPSPRHCGVDRGWHNIIVAATNAWCFFFEQQVTVADQTIEPPQLVVEFWARRGISIGEIYAADNEPIHLGLDVAAVSIIRIPRQPATTFRRLRSSGEDCDTVVRLLAVPYCAVAGVPDRVGRKFVVRRL